MILALTVTILVLAVTAVTAAAGYFIDRGVRQDEDHGETER